MTQLTVASSKDESRVEADASQYLTFYLQEEMFGLNILPIKEICEYGQITPVPMVPGYIRGVINLRGNVVPVIDLPVRFGWEPSPVNKRSCIVIVEINNGSESMEVGIVIDSVCEVLDIPAADIGAPPSFGAKVRTDFISGMGKVGDAFVVLLHADKVLSTDELSQLERVSSVG
jgi:purine-binding chemotaxis protein CheW